MEFKQFLKEDTHQYIIKYKDKSKPVLVYINPSEEEVVHLISKSKHNEIRGIISGTSLYAWQSSEGAHFEVEPELGLPEGSTTDFTMYWKDYKKLIIETGMSYSMSVQKAQEIVRNHLVLRKVINYFNNLK